MIFCRLEKRRQAMLDMPQMIQTWKEVSYFRVNYFWNRLTLFTERTWSWMEEVAEIKRYIVRGLDVLHSIWPKKLVKISHVNGLAWVMAFYVLFKCRPCISLNANGPLPWQNQMLHISSMNPCTYLNFILPALNQLTNPRR